MATSATSSSRSSSARRSASYGDMIIDHIEKKIAKEVGKLRAEVNLKRASDDGKVVLLPNPLRKWSGQA